MTKMPIAVLGIDLGKNSCSVAGLDMHGAVVLRRRMTRESLVAFASKLPACIVAMEACCGAHFLGRTFAAQGHTVRLMSPEYVQPYVKSQKTDDRDAEAIAEAATRPTMRLVTLKSEEQLDLQVLHRARERLIAARTRLTNQLRAVLLERGVILPKRRAPLRHRLHELMAGELPISPRVIRLLEDLRDEWASLDGTEILEATGEAVHAMPYRAGFYNERTPLMREIRRDGIDLRRWKQGNFLPRRANCSKKRKRCSRSNATTRQAARLIWHFASLIASPAGETPVGPLTEKPAR